MVLPMCFAYAGLWTLDCMGEERSSADQSDSKTRIDIDETDSKSAMITLKCSLITARGAWPRWACLCFFLNEISEVAARGCVQQNFVGESHAPTTPCRGITGKSPRGPVAPPSPHCRCVPA